MEQRKMICYALRKPNEVFIERPKAKQKLRDISTRPTLAQSVPKLTNADGQDILERRLTLDPTKVRFVAHARKVIEGLLQSDSWEELHAGLCAVSFCATTFLFLPAGEMTALDAMASVVLAKCTNEHKFVRARAFQCLVVLIDLPRSSNFLTIDILLILKWFVFIIIIIIILLFCYVFFCFPRILLKGIIRILTVIPAGICR